ncbi:MAG: UDP-glucose/GDP-mannose dehydrogenase family protein [Microcystis wesenbergii Mw_QC_S_20081001_S30D]|uniref:UDP-glucose 6-dehydrogenase n=1 Tax=Microcystis wesenbergii Mw_QC_S_20081001_S30D TaxID=2486245 RepID=A0A552JCL5_9CHRO|nr:UDP-glucose/GDP-mannose dehydrogenase family protein [Microcystis aeruginosa W11-03]NCR94016.1 UDP-glucose/GDP-mannose dehydrogenase family protein [Microcystis aeruginosa W11-06]TRU93488.1 MAG: UDP-glucose/GDP-mannose dehydrogenase family protein [Microcystis wesenbergii Mw_QC_S_20081001_S30D]TRV02374.1 MAG: UDP-glucose/GDP-mannose dehydrogenase family protein [Microcystis wesenbergii Mw_QC_B_20070930_S4D]TRV02902.1 MAG: UDP-glucose/GDP-mannose dehydrogenase family protein [Microcystis wese
MRVCVIGTGYVGLVTGVCLAHIGHHVICIDNNEEKVKLMKSGQSPIYEPGLSELMQSSAASGNLEFSTDLEAGVKHGEILFIAVGTPALPTGESDTRYVEAVARGIGAHLNGGYKVIVNKSTVPIGSGDWVRMIVLDGVAERQKNLVAAGGGISTLERIEADFDVVSNPEFLREGSAVYDTFNPDRIVLGSNNPKAIEMMKELYAPLVERQFADDTSLPPVPVVVTDLSSAEMIKYAANAFLATKISFINEVANICDRVGADVTQVAKGIGLDSRIGSKFLSAGIGWGGSCFPKDVSALVHTAEDYGYETELLNAAINVNKRQRTIAIEKLQQELKILKGKTVGLLGLTFKPDTDDMRDAPALTMIEQLNRLGAKVKAYDPIVSQSGLSHGLSGVIIESDPERLADGCDALVVVTEWQEFLRLDYGKMAKTMREPVLIDGRNFLDPAVVTAAGFRYLGIGR